MIDFQRLEPARRAEYEQYLFQTGRKCELSFANLCIWGRQRAAFVDGFLVIFSQFDRRAVYTFPLGEGRVQPVLDAIIRDAGERGIPCCITGLEEAQCQLLQQLYPGRFRFYSDRDTYDYVYGIDNLADLKGRKYQKKRNHFHKFCAANPTWRVEPVTERNLPQVRALADRWYALRQAQDPDADFHLEKLALGRALEAPEKYGMEGLVLYVQEQPTAFTLGSRLSRDTFDVHFEKALDTVDGSYAAINKAFAAHIRDTYPEIRYLNREDDMGLPGLRKAKLSYEPAFLVEKRWARLWEEIDEG